ncbi:hypothetical protein Droror1_Dr00022128 [Drosera rotundifolia]
MQCVVGTDAEGYDQVLLLNGEAELGFTEVWVGVWLSLLVSAEFVVSRLRAEGVVVWVEGVVVRLFVRGGWLRLGVLCSFLFWILWVNDDSCLSNMQCVVGTDAEGYDQVESGSISTGASLWLRGTIVKSLGSKQKVELKVDKLITIGQSDPSFPIQKKRVSTEFLRTKAHLRPRTNTFGASKEHIAYATHKFFQENGFVWISSPIITASDCEGAGEQFCVTTLIPNAQDATHSSVDSIPKTDNGSIDWSQVYTFGPTFRAENSNTSRHLAEFWMIEPELAFADLSDDMACASAYLQYVVRYILENCKEDMEFFDIWIEKGIINRLSDLADKEFVQLTYTDAVSLLLKAKKKFQFPMERGRDLQSEHERYITEQAFAGCPVIIRLSKGYQGVLYAIER